jgi:hypothetical protein
VRTQDVGNAKLATSSKSSAVAKPAASPAAIVTLGRPQVPAASQYTAQAVTTKLDNPANTATASAPASGGSFVAGAGAVVVDIKHSDSDYQNKIYWSSDNWATRNYIGVDNQVGSVNLGSFKAGTKIEFGIASGNNDFYRTGAAGANSDNTQHAQSFAGADGTTIGFEDQRGGGDRDFNDAIITVRSVPGALDKPAALASPAVLPTPAPKVQPAPAAAPKVQPAPAAAPKVQPAPAAAPKVQPAPAPAPKVQPAPAPAPKPSPVLPAKPPVEPAKQPDNRSGLADGTNPGNGNGRVNSPNQGTNNPNQAPAPAAKTIAVPATPPAVKAPVTVKVGTPAQAPVTSKVTAVGAARNS